MILLPQPSQCWDYRYVLPHPAPQLLQFIDIFLSIHLMSGNLFFSCKMKVAIIGKRKINL
jgi:hypothetical protein